MTREEDIKARLAEEFVHWIADDRDFDYKVAGDSAEPDLRYLLARNEELQRRVEFLEDVLSCVKDESPEMRHQVLEYEDKVRQEAKEQHNDQAD